MKLAMVISQTSPEFVFNTRKGRSCVPCPR